MSSTEHWTRMSATEELIDDMMSVFEAPEEQHVLRAEGVEHYLFEHYAHPAVHSLWDWEFSVDTSEEMEETSVRDTALIDWSWLKMSTQNFNRGCELWKTAARGMFLMRVFRRIERVALNLERMQNLERKQNAKLQPDQEAASCAIM
jgi:hypothetical protein